MRETCGEGDLVRAVAREGDLKPASKFFSETVNQCSEFMKTNLRERSFTNEFMNSGVHEPADPWPELS